MIDTERTLEAGRLTEQFIPDHVFMYIVKGAMQCYDGHKSYAFKEGECGIARKNRLARYTVENGKDMFEPVIFCFDEAFLKDFQVRHKTIAGTAGPADTFMKIKTTGLISGFIRSLKPYYDSFGKMDAVFEDVKYEELLLILLRQESQLAGLFFDFGIPAKTDLEAFMNRNYRFNVSMDRFAYMTGRSLSAFKRDFKTIFNEAPGRWLVKKRLQEAYFLIDRKNKRPSDIYIDLGFEALSHFSFAFKKLFGQTPRELSERQ